MKRTALLSAVIVLAGLGLQSCGGASTNSLPSNKLPTRVWASQSASSLTSTSGLVVINGNYDTQEQTPRINAGTSPGYMVMSPERAVVMVFDSAANNIDVLNTKSSSVSGTIALPGPTISMVAVSNTIGYAAVPSAPVLPNPPGAVIAMNLSSGSITASISVPSAQTVVSNSGGSQLLAFSNDSNAVTVVSPLQLNTGGPVTTVVNGFDRPVYAVFSTDNSTAYVLNCGPQCGGTQASVQALNMSNFAVGTPIPVDAATIGLLNGSTLYLAGTPPTNNGCTGQTTAATSCGRLDIIDLATMTVSGRVVITDGYHDRIDISNNGQLFIGSHTCTNLGDVNAPVGEVRGCLSIFNTMTPANLTAVIPPDNGDVTGLQSFASRYVEYVAEGGNLRVYDTTVDKLLITQYIETGTIIITGQITDVKAVDFF